MENFKIYWVLTFFLFFKSYTNNQPEFETLSVENFVEEVIKKNPDIPAIKARVKEAELAITRVKTLDDPILAFMTKNNPFSNQPQLMPKELYFQIGQRIPFPGKLSLQGKIQNQIAQFLSYEELTTEIDLIFQSKKLFFNYYFNKIALEINQENRLLLQRIIEDALALYKSGKGKIEDTLKGEIELKKIEEEYLTLESEKETIKAFMNALRNVPQSTTIYEPAVNFHSHTNFNYDSLKSTALKKRPELKGLKAKISEEEFRAQLAHQEYFPDFEISFMAQRFKNNRKQREFAWGLNIGFNLPIWIPRKQKREFLEARERVTATENQYVGIENNIKARIKEIIEKINSLEEQIILYDEIVKKSTETLFANEFSYRTGKESFLTILDTRRELQNFLLDYEKSRTEKEILLAELERELGIPLEKIIKNGEIVFQNNL